MTTTAEISTGTTLIYEKGRGGTKWPASRYTAKGNGETLLQKDGHPRRFKTPQAARAAAQKFVADMQE